MATTAPSGSTTTRKFHGSKSGRQHGLGGEVRVVLAVADRPLQEGVLDDVVGGGGTPSRLGLADVVPLGQRALGDLRALGQLEHPAGPADVVAERLQQPVAGRSPAGTGMPRTVMPRPRAQLLHPARQGGADARGRAYAGWTAASPRSASRDLGVGDQPVAVEDADGARARRRSSGRCQSPTMSASSISTSPRSASSWAAITSKTARASAAASGRLVSPSGRSVSAGHSRPAGSRSRSSDDVPDPARRASGCAGSAPQVDGRRCSRSRRQRDVRRS